MPERDSAKRVRELIRKLKKAGYRVEQDGKNHYQVYDGTEWKGSMPGTPTTRTFANQLSALRRRGVVVEGKRARKRGDRGDQ
jgi:hypothetical protein